MDQYTKPGLLSKFGRFLETGFSGPKKPQAVASSVSKKDQQTIIQIVQEFKSNSIKDIQDWRDAQRACEDPENPKWNLLQDLFEYLEPDAQLGTSKDIRVASTLGKPFLIIDKKTGKEQPEKTGIFKDKEWFFNFVWEFLESVFFGYTAAQCLNWESMKFFYIPRRNIIPQRDFVLFDTTAEKGVSLVDPALADTVIFLKYKRKFGIVNDIVPNLIWKKNSRQAWHEFSEKFGIPSIWATTTKSDRGTIDKIETMLKQLGEAATAVLPEGTTITIQDQATKGDPYNTWLKQMELDDQQIQKRLLGGTMIIDGGSSRSQSEVHERTLKDVIGLFDKMLVIWLVNDYLMPRMAKHGYPFTEDDAFKFDETEQLSMKDHWSIVKEALDKFDVPFEWVSETFNIPITGAKQAAPAIVPGNDPQEQASFNTPAIVSAAALAGHSITLPDYRSNCRHVHNHPSAGFTDDLLSELSDLLINDIWNGKETLINEVLKSIKAYGQLLDGLHSGWKGFDNISYDGEDNACLSAMEYNLFEFSRLKEKSNVLMLNQLLLDKEKNNIRDFNDFRNQALKYLQNADVNWLRTEYNHAVAVGQNASRYLQFKKEAGTVTRYVQWQTVGDSRVREKHSALEGKIFNLDEPGGLTMWPPKDWGCRCEMIQYLGKPPKELLYTSDQALTTMGIEKGSKWAVNRGDIKQVFTANEMYTKGSLNTEAKQLSYEEYGLNKWDEIKNRLSTLVIDDTITVKNAEELFKPEKDKDFKEYTDYLGRKMMLTKSVFKRHLQGDYANNVKRRHQLFPHINDVLSSPDEVYLFQFGTRSQMRYVKFYKNEVLIVTTDTGAEDVQIKTWFKDESKDDRVYRFGYLIHQKKKP